MSYPPTLVDSNTDTSHLVLGIDFGTTNSSAAVYVNDKVQIIDVDPRNTNPTTLKSSIFITKDQEVIVGQKAIDTYIEKFEGQEIQSDFRLTDDYLAGEANKEGETMLERLVEEYEINLPGRFIISPKRVMPNPYFTGTEVFEKLYTPEDLATFILQEVKNKAGAQLNTNIKNVNIGRPVHFSDIGEDDLAIERITTAAKRVGFENIQFTFEPVGAAHSFAIKNNENKIGLVFDFGGGTFDTSVVEFYPDHSIKVLDSQGVYVGGNKFNENLIVSKFMQYFGRDITWGPHHMKLPEWIIESASKWELSQMMRKKDKIEMIENIRRQSTSPNLVENLLKLIRFNLGLSLFLTAEKSKIDLSQMEYTDVLDLKWMKYSISIEEKINQEEFKKLMWQDMARIGGSIRKVLENTNLDYEDIQVVIKTGGSSRTFFIQEFLQNLFPNAEIYENDSYTDVTAGLAVSGSKLFK